MTGVITGRQAPTSDASDDADNGGVRQLTTLHGWRDFVAERPAVPQLLPDDTWRNLGEEDRLRYDEARLAHHAKLLVVATSTIQQVLTEGRRLQYLNRHAEVGRCGLILSGPARTDKTTCLTQLGKTIETMHTRRHPHAAGHIPVVYITAPPAATPRMIAVEFARFLGLPLTRRANITDVLEAVCGVCLDAATTLICVDEIHNVNLGTRHGAEASDTLKYFAERLPATFVYAGINVERAGLLNGNRGEQIAGRFSMIRTGAFGRGQQWQARPGRPGRRRPDPADPARRLRQRTPDDLRLDPRVQAMCAIAQHLGRPGTPTDQAWIESLNGHLKAEYPHLLAIRDPAILHAELDIARAHHNGVRLHQRIGYVCPNDEHEGRGEAIRQARQAGLETSRLRRLAWHRQHRHDQPVQEPHDVG